MNQKNEKKHRSVLRIQVCLVYLIVVTTLLTGVTFSKYVTRTSGEDAARVIRMGQVSISETGSFTDGKLVLIPGVDLIKDASVIFEGSESASYLFLEVAASAQWETSDHKKYQTRNDGITMMEWQMRDEWKYLCSSSSSEGDSHIYYYPLEANQNLNCDIIKENGKITVSEKMKKTDLKTLTDQELFIGFRAFVVQSGGFATAQDAWESVQKK